MLLCQAQVGGANVPVSASMDKIAPAADATVRGKEQLTLNIPIDATASGGLGLSVRGVTEKINDVLLDRGIFVKSILPNSAAAKVCIGRSGWPIGSNVTI